MISQIGHLTLFLFFIISFASFLIGTIERKTYTSHLSKVASVSAPLQFSLITISMIALFYGFLTSDFSLKLVYEHSHLDKPFIYKFTALWANHEGSMLLWIWVLSFYHFILGFNKDQSIYKAFPFLSLLATGLSGFILFSSNPFNYIFPVPENGLGLNPLLQDPGLAYHPPFLYLGYVGYSVVVAIALSGLMKNDFSKTWVMTLKKWSYVAFSFLTIGITLGSFWAYYELGWGGFWFWDPVENVALIPWLFGLILIHLIRVYEQKKRFLNWILLSSIFAFIFSLIGTFIVRSGILISIHNFSSDPDRGMFLLGLIAFFSALTIFIYCFKFKTIAQKTVFKFFRRDNFIFLQVLIVALISFVIIFGTLYPIIHEVIYRETISVGAPYFNQMIIPITFVLMSVMAIMHILTWQGFKKKHLVSSLLFGCIILAIIYPLKLSLFSFFGIGLSLWLMISIGVDFFIHKGHFGRKIPYLISHFGFAVFILAMAITTQTSTSVTVKAVAKEQFQFGSYDVFFKGIQHFKQDNYITNQAHIELRQDGKKVIILKPERRFYDPPKIFLTETALDVTMVRTLYAVLLPVSQNDSDEEWLITLYHQPVIIWVWIGGILIAIGALLSLLIKIFGKHKGQYNER